jgi:hypothetical protein
MTDFPSGSATLRMSPADAAAYPERIAEFRAEFPDGEVVVDEDTSCPHCRAMGQVVDEHGQLRDAVTGEPLGYVTVLFDERASERAAEQARRAARRAKREGR